MLQIRNLKLFFVVSFIFLFLYQFVFAIVSAEEIPNMEQEPNSNNVNEHKDFSETGK
jgi:hypothetical protein